MRRFVLVLTTVFVATGLYLFLDKKDSQTAPSETPTADSETAAVTSEEGDLAQSQESTEFGSVSDFQLQTQTGSEFQLSSMEGDVLLVSFFFANCQGPCPLMNKELETLQTELAQDAHIKLVSITVDPERDTVEALKTYAANFHADASKWFFLTGSKDVINKIMVEDMKLGGSTETPDTHSTRIALVGPDRQIKGYYDSTSKEELNKMVADARELLATDHTGHDHT